MLGLPAERGGVLRGGSERCGKACRGGAALTCGKCGISLLGLRERRTAFCRGTCRSRAGKRTS